MSLRLPKCFPAPHWLPPASWSLDSILENVHFAADSDPHSGPHCPSGVPSPASWNLEGGSSAALPNLNSALRRDVLPSRDARLHVEQGAARPHRSPQRPFLVASAPTTGPRTRRGSRWGLQGTVFWFHGRPCLLAGLSP